ncbi:MAG: hypothetical protein ACHQIO_22840 [Nevskiales bacterium]
MKKFVLAALAALTLSIGAASAAPVNQGNGLHIAPAYSDDALGGA